LKNILLAFDKFKHTADAETVTDIVKQSLASFSKNITIAGIPLADGGEGTTDILSKNYSCDNISLKVNDPLHRQIDVSYYLTRDNIALIELASASGLNLLKEDERNPMKTSTFGTGEMVNDAIQKGAEKIIIACGGSATNDAGIGALTAIGCQFLDHSGKILMPIGENLQHIHDFQFQNKSAYNDIKFSLLFDVHNEFCGESGAAHIFASQKGAAKTDIEFLDKGLRHFAKQIKLKLGKDISAVPGCGAAGGFTGGFHAFLNAELYSGSKTILEISNFENALNDIDLIVTGEGRFDYQSFNGKITGEVIKIAEKNGVPVVILCGQTMLRISETKYNSIQAILPLFEMNVSIKTAKTEMKRMIDKQVKKIVSML
jgi:glycerate kinase